MHFSKGHIDITTLLNNPEFEEFILDLAFLDKKIKIISTITHNNIYKVVNIIEQLRLNYCNNDLYLHVSDKELDISPLLKDDDCIQITTDGFEYKNAIIKCDFKQIINASLNKDIVLRFQNDYPQDTIFDCKNFYGRIETYTNTCALVNLECNILAIGRDFVPSIQNTIYVHKLIIKRSCERFVMSQFDVQPIIIEADKIPKPLLSKQSFWTNIEHFHLGYMNKDIIAQTIQFLNKISNKIHLHVSTENINTIISMFEGAQNIKTITMEIIFLEYFNDVFGVLKYNKNHDNKIIIEYTYIETPVVNKINNPLLLLTTKTKSGEIYVNKKFSLSDLNEKNSLNNLEDIKEQFLLYFKLKNNKIDKTLHSLCL